MIQIIVIGTHTNPPMKEPLPQPKLTNFMKTKASKNTEEYLNDNNNGVLINSKGLNK